MRTILDPDDVRFLERLHRLGNGTIQEICADLGVTATAVRQRLTRLQGQGMISRELVRSAEGAKSRGRPHHTYRVSEAGRRELGANYSDLAMILWREIQRIDDPEVKRQILGRIEQALVQKYGGFQDYGVANPAAVLSSRPELGERFQELCGTLASHGFDVEYDSRGGLPILRENNCPYLELATSDPSICEMEQSVFRQVLGVKVSLTQCCLDGHHCCEFSVDETTQGADEGSAEKKSVEALVSPVS
jgi:predicted ArsR family transcriptional regulator